MIYRVGERRGGGELCSIVGRGGGSCVVQWGGERGELCSTVANCNTVTCIAVCEQLPRTLYQNE